MPRTIPLAVGFILAALAPELAQSDDGVRQVKVGAVTIEIPKGWKEETPSNRLRLAQFAVPPVDGDAEAAELSVFAFGPGGTVGQQVQRWIGQFEAEGRKYKGTTGKSELGQYVYVELSGTYKKPDGPPVRRRTIPMPGARMLVTMIAVKNKGNYFFKLVGYEKTIAANAQAFRKAIGANSQEKPLELDED